MNKEPDLPSNMRENHQNLEKLKQTSLSQQNFNGSLLTAVSSAKADLVLKSSNNNEKTNTSISNGKSNSAADINNTNFNNNKINVLICDNQIKELHTVLRDKNTSHSDFKFYSDRLIRLLVEESLNVLPYADTTVITSAGCEYNGVKYIKSVCGVSIMRSGEAMEKGLRVKFFDF